MNSKIISFIAMMGVLGNILFLISYYAGPISPGVALDFSLVGAFIAGIFGGPIIGFVSGLFVGVLPGIFFGPLGTSSWLGLIGLPIGKALTGLTSGLIAKGLNIGEKRHSSFTIPVVLVSYIPESVFTVAYFLYLMPFFLGGGGGLGILAFIVPKAWGEVVIISFLMAALVGNVGFRDFVNNFFKATTPQEQNA
jgi:riboflavin transporter FmnP